MTTLDEARAALRLRQGVGARYGAPAAPAADLALARRGTAYFAGKLNETTDDKLVHASRRPGWSRARVAAAVALQARAIAQAIEDANGLISDDRAETDVPALDLAETLPPRALRHLVSHAEIHLNVAWRDLDDAGWAGTVTLDGRPVATNDTPHLRALMLWAGALALGGRLRDVPEALHTSLAKQD
jgi:maleylpyruvate isomerase